MVRRCRAGSHAPCSRLLGSVSRETDRRLAADTDRQFLGAIFLASGHRLVIRCRLGHRGRLAGGLEPIPSHPVIPRLEASDPRGLVESASCHHRGH